MTGYTRKFNENATMSLIVKDKKLLKKYSKIWGTNEGLMKITFESKPVYGEEVKYIKTGSVITNFHNKKMPPKKALCKCLSIIMIDSVIKANKKYYPQTLLEECKYSQKDKNIKGKNRKDKR